MEKNLAPTAAKGKFPYPHRTLHEVAFDKWKREGQRVAPFRQWVEMYHG